ncbi:hypothetical protein LINPERPRIM_LOCUS5456, partial [Linum perenne]
TSFWVEATSSSFFSHFLFPDRCQLLSLRTPTIKVGCYKPFSISSISLIRSPRLTHQEHKHKPPPLFCFSRTWQLRPATSTDAVGFQEFASSSLARIRPSFCSPVSITSSQLSPSSVFYSSFRRRGFGDVPLIPSFESTTLSFGNTRLRDVQPLD